MLKRKMMRDMKERRAQFLSVFLMIFIGMFVFAGMGAEGEGMKQSAERYYEQSNLAAALIYKEGITKKEVQEIMETKGVKKAERRTRLDVGMVDDPDVTIRLNILEKGTISEPQRMKGSAFSAEKDGLWLDKDFADKRGIQTGDTLRLDIQGGKATWTVKGLVMQPEYIYAVHDESELLPDHETYGYAFVSAGSVEGWQDTMYSELLIEGKVTQKALEQSVSDIMGNGVVLMQKEFPGQSMFQSEIEQQTAMQIIFPAAFLLIALLTMMTTMKRMTASQRTQIGTLKALGVKERSIYTHYIGYGVGIGILGSISGMLLGSILLPKLMFSFQANFYTLPEWKGSLTPQIFAAAGICIAACVLTSYAACRAEMKGQASEILRPKAPKTAGHIRIENSKWWKKQSFRFQWNVRDIIRNKMRSVITVLGIAGCMMLTLASLGLKDTIDELVVWMYEDIYTYQTKVILKEADTETRREDCQYIQEVSAELKTGDKKRTQGLTVLGEGTYVHTTDADRKETELPKDGVAVTYKTSQLTGVQTGDVIQWKMPGSSKWTESRVNAVIRSPLSQGIYMTEEAYENCGYTMQPSAFFSGREKDTFPQDQYQAVQSKKEVVEAMDTMLEAMNVMIAILISAAAVLGIVVLYNLEVLSFAEKIRELATLKVLGFHDKKLKQLLSVQNLWLTVCGILTGVPLGIWLLSYMLQYMGDTMDMMPVIENRTYICSILGIFLLSVCIQKFQSRQMRTIDMVSALKGVE